MFKLDKQKFQVVFTAFTLVIVCILLVFVVYAFTNQTVAWFSANDDVKATGMTVKSDTTANLSIAENVADILNNGQSISHEDEYKTLEACTNIDGVLKYYKYSDIDPKTGKAKDGTTAITAVKDKHYIEYTVYLGSTGYNLVCDKLEAQIVDTTITNDYSKAASIDFIVNDVYKGTLNLIDLTKTVDLGVTVVNVNNPLKITIRCYFDGALVNSSGQAYLRSGNIGTENININILYKATNPSSGK